MVSGIALFAFSIEFPLLPFTTSEWLCNPPVEKHCSWFLPLSILLNKLHSWNVVVSFRWCRANTALKWSYFYSFSLPQKYTQFNTYPLTVCVCVLCVWELMSAFWISCICVLSYLATVYFGNTMSADVSYIWQNFLLGTSSDVFKLHKKI